MLFTAIIHPCNTSKQRDFASAIYQTQQRGGGLSVARFAFDPEHPRAQFDGARIISRLMRQMDFGKIWAPPA